MPRWTRVLAALVAACLVLSACKSSKPKKKEGAATTTSAPGGPPVPGPLTGTDVPEAKAKRPVLIVKIDNDPRARPQAGLNQADVVVEELVEGGATRLAAVFQGNDADSVGPVRSARSTDVNFFTSMSRPLFAYSGANSVFRVLLRRSVFVDVGVDALPAAYQRKADRPAPSNLFTATPPLFAKAPSTSSPPAPFWAFRAAGAPVDGTPTATATVEFKATGRTITTTAVWSWDAASGTWRRAQNGTPHVDAAGAPVAAKNVVIQFVAYKTTGLKDKTETAVPEADVVGEGGAWFLTDGKLVKGTWRKGSITKATEYLDGAGKPIALTPGQSWIELAPTGSASAK
jgi:hypothetical protein